ncbi:MAG: CvpA family protein [Patescibacteria group bacterium]|jgi:membrane protein required for colicin V production
MTYIDIILIVLLGGFVFSGFKGGFIYSFGSFLGVIIGAFVAGIFYEPLAEVMGNGADWANIIAFLGIFFVVSQLIGIISYTISKALKLLLMFPFLIIINKVGGLIFGFIEGVLFLSIGVFFILHFELADKIIETLGNSSLIPIFEKIGSMISFLLPTVIRELDTIL